MKKQVFKTLCSALLLSAILISCKKDKDEEATLFAKWQLVETATYNFNNPSVAKKDVNTSPDSFSYEFFADGNAVASSEERTFEHPWKDEQYPDRVIVGESVTKIHRLTNNELLLLIDPYYNNNIEPQDGDNYDVAGYLFRKIK